LDLFLERDYFNKRGEKQNSFQINRQKKLLLDRLHTQPWIHTFSDIQVRRIENHARLGSAPFFDKYC
jgi:hypothetical protein